MARRRKGRLPRETTGLVVLDSGAITKIADAGDPLARTIWRQLTARGWTTCIPAVTLSEATTGKAKSDATTNLLVKNVNDTVPCDEALGRAAGMLRGTIAASDRKPSGIDAIVAAVAARSQPSVVLTTDPEDMTALLAGAAKAVVIAV